MSGLYITVDGVVGTEPRRSAWEGDPIISFRFVTNERRYDRLQGQWVNGHSSWMTVSCFRGLAKNVDQSIRKGDRLVVHGKMRVRDFVGDDGVRRTGVTLEADIVGHNLRFGTARFRPVRMADATEERIRAQADELMRELADEPPEDVGDLLAQRAAAEIDLPPEDDEDDEFAGPDQDQDQTDDGADDDASPLATPGRGRSARGAQASAEALAG